MTKKITSRLFAAALLVSAVAFSQPLMAQEAAKKDKQFDKVFTAVEQTPEYPGGQADLMRYMAMNIRYPEQAIDAKVQGKVFVSFIVDQEGMLHNFKVEKGIGAGCDQEAVRVLAQSRQPWAPAKQNGRPVNFKMVVPVMFKLAE